MVKKRSNKNFLIFAVVLLSILITAQKCLILGFAGFLKDLGQLLRYNFSCKNQQSHKMMHMYLFCSVKSVVSNATVDLVNI